MKETMNTKTYVFEFDRKINWARERLAKQPWDEARPYIITLILDESDLAAFPPGADVIELVRDALGPLAASVEGYWSNLDGAWYIDIEQGKPTP